MNKAAVGIGVAVIAVVALSGTSVVLQATEEEPAEPSEIAAAVEAGTTITVNDATWTCNRALTSYGPLPIRVTSNWTKTNVTAFGIRLGQGCVGTGNFGDCQLVLSSNADGISGPYDDAVRGMTSSPGARDMVICGSWDCGRVRGSIHQDGAQFIGTTNITLRDMRGGLNGTGGTSPSCKGAGGGVFYSSTKTVRPVGLRVEGGIYAGCNVSLKAGGGSGQSGHVENAIFRNGYDKANPDACRNNEGAPANIGRTCNTDTTEPITITTSNIVCDKWPWAG